MSHTKIAAHLRARLKELDSRAAVIEDDLRHPLDANSTEQAIDLADDEALTGVDDVLRREIVEIKGALLRLKNGTYGICTSCGKPIDAARLQALPTAAHCITCR